MNGTMDQELVSLARYRRLIETLANKTKNKRYLLYRDPSLRWIVANQTKAAQMIVKFLKDPNGFQLSEFKKQNIYIDKLRVTFNTEWPEKLILMNMGKIIAEYTESKLSENLFSYRKNRGPHLAIQSLTSYLRKQSQAEMLYVFKTDIDDYTNSMDKQTLLRILEENSPIRDNGLFHSVFSQLLNFSYTENDQIFSTSELPIGVPIGIPLVPLLNNLYLMSLDEVMSAHKDIFYARYGDDILIASPNLAAYHLAVKEVESKLHEKKLKMKARKTFHINYGYKTHNLSLSDDAMIMARRIEWLGFSVFANGETGPKSQVYKEFVARTKSEIFRLISLANQFPGDRSEKIEFLKHNFKPIWANPHVHPLARKFTGIENKNLFDGLNQYFANYFTRKLARVWNINKKDAWAIYRRVKVPSLKTSNQWEDYDWVA